MTLLPPALRSRIRMPLVVLVASLLLLGVNVLLGALAPHGQIWILEVFIAMTMVAIVILFSMELLEQPGITRIFAALGFFWVAILFTLTIVDYATR
jgi:cytochrome c oxidase subunit 4